MFNLIHLIKKTYHMAEPHEGRLVLTNVASLSGLQAVTYILPLLIIPYLFQVIGPEKFGLIAFAQAFTQYFFMLTDYGFSISATQEISLAQNKDQKLQDIFAAVMTIKTVLALASLVIIFAATTFIPKFRAEAVVFFICYGSVIGTILFPLWFFQGIERMNFIANLNIAGELITAFLIVLLVRSSSDYLMVPLIQASVVLATGIVGQYIAFKYFSMRFKPASLAQIKYQLIHGWNVFISIVAINAYTTTRIFAVGLLTNNTMTGFYSIAEKIANVVQTFPLSSFSQAIFPRLSKIFEKNQLKALQLMEHIQLITIQISLICLPIIFLLAPHIVNLACGGHYPQTILSLRLLLISVFFISANAFRVQFLIVSGNSKIYSRIHLIIASLALPLVVLLIYTYSYVGAALATVIVESAIFTRTYLTVKKLKLS